jgi:hypothetical protein
MFNSQAPKLFQASDVSLSIHESARAQQSLINSDRLKGLIRGFHPVAGLWSGGYHKGEVEEGRLGGMVRTRLQDWRA